MRVIVVSVGARRVTVVGLVIVVGLVTVVALVTVVGVG